VRVGMDVWLFGGKGRVEKSARMYLMDFTPSEPITKEEGHALHIDRKLLAAEML